MIDGEDRAKDIEPKLASMEWLGVSIEPMSLSAVDRINHAQYKQVLTFKGYEYITQRTAKMLLGGRSNDYAKLPPIEGRQAEQVFKNLPKDSEWLDLGCGSGDFLVDVIGSVNQHISAVGFDARTWEDNHNLPELVLGNIYDVDLSMFAKHPNGFNLITSASVFYHLSDYWNVLKRVVSMLKSDGKFLLSTIPRPIDQYGHPINDEAGKFTENPRSYSAIYYNNRNLFDCEGNLLSMAEVVDVLNRANKNVFKLEYHSSPSKNVSVGQLLYGGGLSGRKIDFHQPSDFSSIFYCSYAAAIKVRGNSDTEMSFVVARNDEEKRLLRRRGFVSVEDRYSVV